MAIYKSNVFSSFHFVPVVILLYFQMLLKALFACLAIRSLLCLFWIHIVIREHGARDISLYAFSPCIILNSEEYIFRIVCLVVFLILINGQFPCITAPCTAAEIS